MRKLLFLAPGKHQMITANVSFSFQDIDAKEAVKDWRGERSERIKRMQNTISNNLREVERLEAELQDFPDLDELTPEETTEWAHFKSQKDRAE